MLNVLEYNSHKSRFNMALAEIALYIMECFIEIGICDNARLPLRLKIS